MRYVCFICLILLVSGCSVSKTPVDIHQQQIPKIDIHSHYSYPRSFLPGVLDSWNMRAIVVEVIRVEDTKRRFTRRLWPAIVKHHKLDPDRIWIASSFDATKIDEADFSKSVIEQLRNDISYGARMVKVWKEIGMEIRDSSGVYIQIDDPRFQPIWNFLIEEQIPVLAHIGEPKAAWLPLDTKSPHYKYYKDYPEYHAYQHPEVPSWETIMAARDRWLANNPELVVIGAHLGSMAHDVDEVANRFDRYPNFYAGTAARFGDLAMQPSDKVRAFFIKYQDRLLYGTDLRTGGEEYRMSPDRLMRSRELIELRFDLHWTYLATADSVSFEDYGMSFQARTKGLALPESVLRKFYAGNALDMLNLRNVEH